MKRFSLFKVILTVALVFVLINCSLIPEQRQQSMVKPEVREVLNDPRNENIIRHRILVLPFLDEQPSRGQRVADEARRSVIRELARTGQFVMVALEDFPQDPKKFLTPDGEYDLHGLSQIATGLGVAAVVEGKVLQVKAQRMGDQVGIVRQIKAKVDASVRLRMYAGKNGREILNEVRSGSVETATTKVGDNAVYDRQLEEDPELVQQAVKKAVYGSLPNMIKAVEKLNWEGRIAMVSGERVFINAGRLSGLQVGDLLKVTDEGDEVFDPETGRFIGKAPGRMKGTIEVISYFGKDGAITVIHSGSGFKENDKVELY